jgi:hypothetical protein
MRRPYRSVAQGVAGGVTPACAACEPFASIPAEDSHHNPLDRDVALVHVHRLQ